LTNREPYLFALAAGRRTVEAGPRPILGSLDQSRTKRIPLDVPQHQPEVVMLLDGEGDAMREPEASMARPFGEIR